MAPFRKPPQYPPQFTHSKDGITSQAKFLIETSRNVHDEVVRDVAVNMATFKNTLKPLSEDENDMRLSSHILGFYQAVSPSKELRDASTEADKALDEYYIESSMREDVFELVDAVYRKQESLEAESQRYLEKNRKDYIRNGLSLPRGPKRDRFKEIKNRLSTLSIEFQKNLNEENGGLWFTEEELEGVPQDVIDGLAKEEGENAGKLRLTFKYPDLLPTLNFAKSAETRKTVYVSNENKVNQNVPLFKEAIVLRDEAARLLGYPSHAQFIIEDKMAKTAKSVDEFLGDLRDRLQSAGEKERNRLKSLKKDSLKEREEQDDGRYYSWDQRFYHHMLLEKTYRYDEAKITEYFPLQTTLSGMLKTFETLLGLEFVEIVGTDRDLLSETGKGADIAWHPDVQIFAVWDDESEGRGFVGYLYTDLHPREGKYGHAANFNIQPGFIQPNGSRHYPCTALVCNFSKPNLRKPSLLKHDEVVTLFHELGHGIHDLVSRTHYSRFHGTNVVRDFVEAPSQMLENWCWTLEELKHLSCHYSSLSPEYFDTWEKEAGGSVKSPSREIPDDLANSLIKTRFVNQGIFTLRQLFFGIFDMAVHEPNSHEAIEELDATILYNKLRNDISRMDGPEALGSPPDWGHGQATFGHLMGGYDAGYYGYLASQVYSADMFHSVFAADPLNKIQGRRYRHSVLEKGGSRDEMDSLVEFLGRKPNSEAFYRELGLS